MSSLDKIVDCTIYPGDHLRASFDSTSRQQHVSTISRELHREATMAQKHDEAIGQLVRQRGWLQKARIEVRLMEDPRDPLPLQLASAKNVSGKKSFAKRFWYTEPMT